MFPRWLWLNHVPPGMHLSKDELHAVRDRVRAMGPGQRRFTNTSRRMLKHLLPGMGILTVVFIAWVFWLVTYRPHGSTMVLLNFGGIVVFKPQGAPRCPECGGTPHPPVEPDSRAPP